MEGYGDQWHFRLQAFVVEQVGAGLRSFESAALHGEAMQLMRIALRGC